MNFPDILAGRDFQSVVKAVIKARKNERPVIFALGGHVIKNGCGKYLIKLIENDIISSFVFTGCGIIHDLELAHFNTTSEKIAFDGTFPRNVEIPSRLNTLVARNDPNNGYGLGEIFLNNIAIKEAGFSKSSILCSCKAHSIPITVHIGIGTDTTAMFPNYDGAAWGRASFIDFQNLCSLVGNLQGGVWFNVGSAVQLPEIFLKAINMAFQKGNKPMGFTAVNMDFIKQYRPTTRVLEAAKELDGEAYNLIGHHEIMIPLLIKAILEKV